MIMRFWFLMPVTIRPGCLMRRRVGCVGSVLGAFWGSHGRDKLMGDEKTGYLQGPLSATKKWD